jgi:transposase
VAFREAGLSYREIAFRVDRSVATVVRICQIWEEERRGIRQRPIGQPRRTTARQDRRLSQTVSPQVGRLETSGL